MSKVKPYISSGETIRELVYEAKEKFPTNAAFKVKENGEIKTITFIQMIKEVESLGTELASMGLDGSRMGIIGENSYPWYNCFLSIVCGGNVAVPFDKGLTVEELVQCVKRSDIKVLFYDEKYAATIEQIKTQCSEDIKYLRITGENNDLDAMKLAGELKMKTGDRNYIDRPVNRADLAVFIFTSGTTSTSKVVMLTHDNIASNCVDMHHSMLFFHPDDVNMAFLPFHHAFGLVGVLVFMAAGACAVFCDGLKYVQKNLQEYGVTVFVGVPLIVESLYNKIMKQVEKQGKLDTVKKGLKIAAILEKMGINVRRKLFAEIIDKLGGKLRLIICGAAPLSPEVGAGLNGFGITTVQGYGLTETSPVLAAERPWDLCAGSVGLPMRSVKIIIDSPDENGIGEVVVWGPNVMHGYYQQPEATDEVIKKGWFYTGDLGRIDEKGRLWICGRKKNVIVMKNGKNIFPEELETLIGDLPYVAENMIFTRDKHNELVIWVKIVYNQAYLEAEGLSKEAFVDLVKKDLAAINDTLPSYKYVNHFILSDEPMIMTTSMKVKRPLEMKAIEEKWEETEQYNVTR